MNVHELKRLRDLNMELAETLVGTLHALDDYCKEHSVPLMNDQKILYFVNHVTKLFDEINQEIYLPPFLQHRKRTPPDATKPRKERVNGLEHYLIKE